MIEQFRDADGRAVTFGLRVVNPHLGQTPGVTGLNPEDEAMANKRKVAPSDGTYQLGRGTFRIMAGDPLPEGAVFTAKSLPTEAKQADESNVLMAAEGENSDLVLTGPLIDPEELAGRTATVEAIGTDERGESLPPLDPSSYPDGAVDLEPSDAAGNDEPTQNGEPEQDGENDMPADEKKPAKPQKPPKDRKTGGAPENRAEAGAPENRGE